MGLLDYYRQFEGMTEEEVNSIKREEAAERKRKALARQEPLDLSQTTWPSPPHPYVVNAVTYLARRGMQRYPIAGSNELRAEIAHRHGLDPSRVAVGHGAAQLLGAATQALVEPMQELITPWPSYPLFPTMARRARGNAVPVTGADPDTILGAVNERTRVVALASPNDPTGFRLPAAELERLLDELPEQVAVLLDEALIDFADAEPPDAAIRLLDAYPRMLVFRSFSKAWGLAGLRCGYALGGPGAEELVALLAPELGVGELTHAGVLEALHTSADLVARRARGIAAERDRLTGELRRLGLDVAPSQANFLWVAHPERDGAAVADGLARAGVLVAAGGPLGDPARVRITVRDEVSSQRLLRGLQTAV
jgi:histidinol-phosphate aminotransferase